MNEMKVILPEMDDVGNQANNIFYNLSETGSDFSSKFVPLDNTGLYDGLSKLSAQITSLANSLANMERIIKVQTGKMFEAENNLTNTISNIFIYQIDE